MESQKICKTILSVSLKGGVGKTTVAVGLAKALVRQQYKVGILDLDYRGPCVPLLLGADSRTIEDTIERGSGDTIVPALVDGLYVFSMAYIWSSEQCVLLEDSTATDDVVQLLSPGVIAWPDLDYLVIDTPPTSSGIVRVALEHAGQGGAVIVTHPSTLSKADTIRTFDLFREKQVGIYALVSNQGMNEWGQWLYDLTDYDIEKLAVEYKIPIFLAIPHARDLASIFDGLARHITLTEPVKLAPEPAPEDIRWQKLVQIARTFRNK